MKMKNRIAAYLPAPLRSQRASRGRDPQLPDAEELAQRAEAWVQEHPGAALAAAFAAGVVIAWWIKRR
jgi:hypothetical protein